LCLVFTREVMSDVLCVKDRTSRKSQVCDIVENPVMVTQNVIITALCDGHGA